MAQLRIGKERAHKHDASIGQGCSYSCDGFSYTLHVRGEKHETLVTLNAAEALRVLNFLDERREVIKRFA